MIAKDLGFVLKRYNFRETSLITSFYTYKFGKITGILKGFYTAKKEFSSGLDQLSLNELIFYPKKSDVWLISFVDLVCDYDFLRKDITRAKVASIFLDLIDKVMQPWDKNPDIFNLLKDCLSYIKEEDAKKILYIFLIKFLTLSGFKPEFGKCLVCHKPVSEHTLFSVSRGGLICRTCSIEESDTRQISREIISSLFYIQNNVFPLVLRINPTAGSEKEMIYLLREFLCCHLDIDISPKLS